MAFNMNKSVIKGTKVHSALLKTAEVTRTHGGDPALGLAAKAYGESLSSPDVIDYNIKSRELDWTKKKEAENIEEEQPVENNTTVEEKKITTANSDKDAALDRLRAIVDKRLEEPQYPDPEPGTGDTDATIDNYDDLDYDAFNPPEEEDIDDIPTQNPQGTTTGTIVHQFAGDVKALEGVKVSKLERPVVNADFFDDNKENPAKYTQILIDGEKTWVVRPWFTEQKKKIERDKKTKAITDKIKSIFTPKKVVEEDVEKQVIEKKESTTSKTNKPKVEDFRKENNMINMKEYFKALREWKQQNK